MDSCQVCGSTDLECSGIDGVIINRTPKQENDHLNRISISPHRLPKEGEYHYEFILKEDTVMSLNVYKIGNKYFPSQ